MHHRIRQLRAACLPFITRSLRGPRRRRFMLGSGIVTVLVVLMGLWAAQSSGDMARETREGLGFEQNRWENEEVNFVLFVDTELERDQVLRTADLARLDDTHHQYWSPLHHQAQEGWLVLDHVTEPHLIAPRGMGDLLARARKLRNDRTDLAPPDLEERRAYVHFNWYEPRQVQRLRAIVDAKLQPKVVIYRSPLDAAGTVRLIGGFAGALLLLLGMVVAPLWVGMQLAQELHDNTLQPLMGTALSARQLVVGLVAGALTPVAIIGAPLLGLHMLAALGSGSIIPALGFDLMTLAMSGMLTGLAMLVALSQGRTRAPGLVGIALLALLGVAALFGLTLGLNLRHDVLGAVTVIPGAGPAHLLAEAFFPVNHLDAHNAAVLDIRLALATLGAVVLAAIIMRGIEKRVAGTDRDGAIGPIEATIAAFTLALLAVAALPEYDEFGVTFFVAIALVAVPLQLVLAGRVPGGDVPPSMKRVPLVRLLWNHAAWVGFGLAGALLVSGPPTEMHPHLIVGLMHLGWAVGVTALITIRATARPTSVLSKVWLLVCLIFVTIEYSTAVMWCMERPDAELLFPLAAASPILGLLQLGMFLWIPISLVRALLPTPNESDAAAPFRGSLEG